MYEMDVSFDSVMEQYGKSHWISAGSLNYLQKAYAYAGSMHAGTFRGSGEPYIHHPLRVARMIAEWGFDTDMIAAALLHDVAEDCGAPLSEIARQFGGKCAEIVDAVTSLSDRDFAGHALSKEQTDLLSDARLQRKMNEKALYVKIADRIDNLNTLFGVEESKRIPKAEHTREIIIPMARLQRAHHLADTLEELCFQVEHARKYDQITRACRVLREENRTAISHSLRSLREAFETVTEKEPESLFSCRQRITRFVVKERSACSIFRQISQEAANITRDMQVLLKKKQVELYDLTLVLTDPPAGEQPDDPMEVFFVFFDRLLSGKGFFLIGFHRDLNGEDVSLILADQMDNRFRMYVKTDREYRRFLYGNMIDEEKPFRIGEVNEIDPRDTYNEKIKVFRKDGSAMMIDKGATVLDFAFHIHTDLGYHFSYAMIDESKARLPAHTRLNEGDTITVVAGEAVSPAITWFKYVRTTKAVHDLVRYFSSVLST